MSQHRSPLSDDELDAFLSTLTHLSPTAGFSGRVMRRVNSGSPKSARPAWPSWARSPAVLAGAAFAVLLLVPAGLASLGLLGATFTWGPGAVYEFLATSALTAYAALNTLPLSLSFTHINTILPQPGSPLFMGLLAWCLLIPPAAAVLWTTLRRPSYEVIRS